MSSLWKKCDGLKLLILQKRPSPTKFNHIACLAQSIKFPLHNSLLCFFIKRISLFTSCRAKIEGSMTVEASIVLPLFLFFFLNLGSAIEMIRLHGNLELALWETGNDLALYGHVIDDGNRLTGVALSYTYVKSRIINSLGEEYLDNSPLSNGTKGLQFWETQMWKEDDTFDVVLTYSVSPFCSMVGFDSFRMANRYYGHLWTGYQINREEEYVYITEAGEVYHTSADCTHLKLSIRQVDYQVAVTSTNRQGFRYQPCEKCSKSGAASRVYITSEGICYHFERDCSGLKRTVISVPLSGVKKYRLCQRCSQQKQKQNTD